MPQRSIPGLDGLDIDALIGDRQPEAELEITVDFVRGRSVLITGAGGSIGSELCRQLVRFEPAEIIMLDRDETALQQVQVSVDGHGLLDTKNVVLADIRDADAIRDIMLTRRRTSSSTPRR